MDDSLLQHKEDLMPGAYFGEVMSSGVRTHLITATAMTHCDIAYFEDEDYLAAQVRFEYYTANHKFITILRAFYMELSFIKFWFFVDFIIRLCGRYYILSLINLLCINYLSYVCHCRLSRNHS
jgi:hypothetical protein